MDKKDERILTELTLNSRIPLNRLGKKVGLSREVVNYRLNNLIKKGVIREFYTIIDESCLNYKRFGCLLQLKGVSLEKERELISRIEKSKFTNYAGTNIGKWNLAFDIFGKDEAEVEEELNSIFKQDKEKIEYYCLIGGNLIQEVFPTKIFNGKETLKENKVKLKKELDQVDINLLKSISKNSREEYTKLSKKLNLTANAIKNRIKNLEKSGIIKGYTISIDYKKLGYDWHNLQVKLFGFERPEKLMKFLREAKGVIYFYRYWGNSNWDMDIGILTKSSDELRNFIIRLKESFPEIKINDLYLTNEIFKDNSAPEGIFKKEN
ncbi:MAG: winged helix-turn-helix transcriptional regulator [Candidatus Pacearchaeota archaeon]|nr:winged helix-turn-helix transcriptional regulator [Candidatus Pacearchaeota archaeon]